MNKKLWVWVTCIALLLTSLSGAEVIRDTSFGLGADTFIGNDSNKGPNNNYGGGGTLDIRIYPGVRAHIGYVKFDISGVSGNMADAQLQIYITSGGSARTWDIYGLIDNDVDDAWGEMTITYNNAPGMLAATAGNFTIDAAKLTLLGTLAVPSTVNVTVTSSPATLNLASFLKSDTNGLVTFVLIPQPPERQFYVASKEGVTTENGWIAPTLIMPNASLGGASEPEPKDGSTVTDLNLSQLCWKNTANDLVKVWFGQADANEVDFKTVLTPLAVIEAPEESECLPIPAAYLPLDVPATYTWAVESWAYPDSDPNHYGEPNEFLNVQIWKFYTSAIPLVETSPDDQYKFPGETAAFTASFESLTELTNVIWLRNGQPVNYGDFPRIDLSVTPLGEYQYETTLTVHDIGLADDGAYTCVAENAGGASEATGIGYLVVKRKLAQWGFDGNADDATGVYNGTLFGDPNFVVDGVHSAMEFDGADDYVQLPEGFANFRSGLTSTLWVKPYSASTWARFFDFGNGAGVNNVFLTRNGTTSNLTFNTSNGLVTANGALALNEWQFFAVTMTEAGNVVMYKNGLQIQTGSLGVPAVVTRTLNYIGESNWEADALYRGLMDDLRIYNYALDADTLATMYSDMAGRYCRVRPALDWDGNCIVDITDFATFAQSWLECGLWPDCDL
jgi:hypothetical protein